MMYRLFIATLLSSVMYAQAIGQDAKPCPCCTPSHRQFDFWLGDWTTTVPSGKTAGTNHIILLQDSCILQENWTSASGKYTGTSYNFFEPADSTWNQIWLDNQGGNLVLKGRRTGNQMILSSGVTHDSEGHAVVNRITWTANADGSVRQLWETSTDNGEWVTAFDGLYRKD